MTCCDKPDYTHTEKHVYCRHCGNAKLLPQPPVPLNLIPYPQPIINGPYLPLCTVPTIPGSYPNTNPIVY